VEDVAGTWVCTSCGRVEGAVYVAEEEEAPRPTLAQRQEDDEENWYREYPESEDAGTGES